MKIIEDRKQIYKQGTTTRDLNSLLRERDKVKDDAIAYLSEQLLALSKATRA